MSLNIKNDEVVRLAEWICERTGETKTEAIRVSLEQRAASLGREGYEQRANRMRMYIREVAIPKFGEHNDPIPQSEQDDILGFGENGV